MEPYKSNNEEDWDDLSIKEYSEMQKYAFISLRAIEKNHIGYCYRESSEFKIDSGWRFIYGDEDEDYLDNPQNVDTKNLSEIVEYNSLLKDILSARRGSEFEWNEVTNRYEQM